MLYSDDVAIPMAKMVKSLEIQLKSRMFDGSNAISILSVLLACQMTLDTNGVYGVVGRPVLHFFIKPLPVPPSVPKHVLQAHVGPVRIKCWPFSAK